MQVLWLDMPLMYGCLASLIYLFPLIFLKDKQYFDFLVNSTLKGVWEIFDNKIKVR